MMAYWVVVFDRIIEDNLLDTNSDADKGVQLI